jgi:hypothetical protein
LPAGEVGYTFAAMAKYQPAPGEVELFKEVVETRYNKRRGLGTLLVTDRRVVLIARPPSQGGVLLGPLGALIERLLGAPDRVEQIDRDDFAAVEQVERGMLNFYSKGEGYAHISFIAYTRTPLKVWQERMQHWVSEEATAALPTARTER